MIIIGIDPHKQTHTAVLVEAALREPGLREALRCLKRPHLARTVYSTLKTTTPTTLSTVPSELCLT